MGVEEFTLDGAIAVRIYRGEETAGVRRRGTLVMVHEGSHASWSWERWARHLAGVGYDCVLFDWLNHGESSRQPVDAFCRRGIQKVATQEMSYIQSWFRRQRLPFAPIVVGHGMGALAALTYAAGAMTDASKLVLVSPVVPMQVQAEAIPIDVTFGRPFAPPPYKVAKRLFFTTMTDQQARREYALLEPESPRAMWEATRSTTWVTLANVTCPTLVITGEQDALLPPANAATLAKLLGAGPPVELAGLGHSDVLLKDDGWRAGADTVLDWIGSR